MADALRGSEQPAGVAPTSPKRYSGRMNAVRKALRAVEGFFRLMVGDTSMLEPPDLSPLDHVPSVEELLRGVKPPR